MNLAEYQTLTGTTVSASQTALYTAQIARTQIILESMLGYSLSSPSTNFYNELGKTRYENPCSIVDTTNLDPADAVVYAYRIYDYRESDPFFYVDPFTDLHKVKLITTVDPIVGNNGVTVKTFKADEYRIQYSTPFNWAKYIHHTQRYRRYECLDFTFQLAVDATWTSAVPTPLQYAWADMITYYAMGDKKNVKSETIGPHSYTLGNIDVPQELSANLKVIQQYAGPKGEANPLKGKI